jgi:membrane associated rhomboid family serine protease
MVFAPINTDAPIYHWPKATVGLIAANLLAFVLIASGAFGEFEQAVSRFGLTYGSGLRPWQWVTSSFVHWDLVHVLGNMLFLWGLGLVVEGKIGWRPFLALYLGLGVTECAIEQMLSFGTRGVSAGASSIVFGLLAVALVWAPRNELEFGYWLPALRWGTFELSIVLFAVLVLIGQGLVAWWLIASGSGMTLTTPLLHLLGAVLGFAYATMAIRRDWVDCEGWDLYSVLQGRHARPVPSDQYVPIMERDPSERPRPSDPDRKKPTVDPVQYAVLKKVRCIKRVRKLVAAGEPREAYQLLRKTQHVLDGWHLPERDLVALGDALQRASLWPEAIAVWEEYVESHPDSADTIRLTAAELLLVKQRRPHAALRILEPIAETTLHPKQERRRQAIERDARRLIESGLIEIDQSASR